MSKITAFLFVVLFAVTANSAGLSASLEKIQHSIEGIIETAINDVKEKSEAVQASAEELVAQLVNEANEIDKKVREEIKQISEKAKEEMSKLNTEIEGVDVTECTAMIDHLEYTGLAVMANMSVCISDKLAAGYGYTDSIFKATMDVLDDLNEIKDEARLCSDKMNGVASIMKAIMCANVAGAKATWAATKAVPSMTVKITKLNVLLATLVPSLAWCKTTTGIHTLYQESSTIVERTTKCLQQKMDEVRPTK